MAGQEQKRFQIIDAQQRLVGETVIECIDKDLLAGRLIPGPEYSCLEHLFREFEEAANLQALHRVDELDAVIGGLGLHLRSLDGSRGPAIRDMQIWSDGAITCRLVDSALHEAKGTWQCRPS
jgi:hypothetical protein